MAKEKEPKFSKYLRKQRENDRKLLPKLLKYIGKIKSIADYEEYKKKFLFVPFIDSFIEIQFRALIILIIAFCLSASLTTPNMIFLAEGISLTWFLLIELKSDLWRK